MKKYIWLNLLFTTNVGIFAQASEWSWNQSETDFFYSTFPNDLNYLKCVGGTLIATYDFGSQMDSLGEDNFIPYHQNYLPPP